MKRPAQYSPIQAALFHQKKAQYMAQLYNAQTAAAQQAALYSNTYNTASTTSATSTAWVTLTPPVTGTMTTTATAPTTLANAMMNSLYSSQHLSSMDSALVRETLRLMGDCYVGDGEPCTIHLPDGGILEVDADGSYRINDADAKVIYRANRVRDFNSFVNASDKLEDFIRFCGKHGVTQSEMIDIPIKHFIAWLIIEAAKADGEQEPATSTPALPPPRSTRCRCGRFMPRRLVERKIGFCRPICLEAELAA